MQVRDILRAIDYLTQDEHMHLWSIALYGRKDMAVPALYAGALDNRISRVILEDPPSSHWEGPPLLNALRFTDLPEIAAMLAPREIVSLTALPEAYCYTSSIFELYGKPENVSQRASLGEAAQ